MAAKPADRIGYIKCPVCGFADANVNVSVKTQLAYHLCPKCKDFTRGSPERDKMLRATMHTKPKGEALSPKRDRGRPRKPKSKTKPPKEPVVDDDDDDDDGDDDEQGDFWKFW